MSQRDGDIALKFQRVLRKGGVAFLSVKRHLRKAWQENKALAVDKRSRHGRDDTQTNA
ncbi:hypothetical protein F4827_003168 [Paraburkholderia bannensis]|uniref:Uncharacterized protein n=1 Tax=Paraburkholderia bannensis TaxID=765414 RepID=A0A7W9TXQ1_9BURK|nr:MULTISPECIES: hypothetical protein [Paraburkholderia]MBB3258300.1 hypothetical protein [Paraburkholderia sp. WP4_3_2]MBB6103313.1 hypothetical protein [Paraburkholderia bannensis]